MTKGERTRALRYKRPALASMGYAFIDSELDEITEACDGIRYFFDNEGGDNMIIDALDGDEDEAFEFKMAFSDLSGKCEQLREALYYNVTDTEEYDDCTVALVGNRYTVVGYDGSEEDYFSLTSYQQELAVTESGKRLMRLTKERMISTIGQSVGIMISFIDLRQQYDYIKATMDIIRGNNESVLNLIREIDNAYNTAAYDDFYQYGNATKYFNKLIDTLPDRAWIE